MSDPVTSTLLTIAIGGFALIAMLYSLSQALMHEIRVTDLRRETARLHREHMERMSELRAGKLTSADLLKPASQAA